MREVSLRVSRRALEDVLDRLLPIVPGGVREVPRGRHVELRVRGADLPDRSELAWAAGRWSYELSEREVPDDWRERRLLDYEPRVIGGRLVVRPKWAPPTKPGLIDLVIADTQAFGKGAHPTTRMCLELLLGLDPAGAFADLGCGTGVQAILAALLGWSPVIAVDIAAASLAATAANAQLNGVQIDTRLVDLAEQAPPAVQGVTGNFPAGLHQIVAANLPLPLPGIVLLSGFSPDEADAVTRAYAARGLHQRERREELGWCVVVLERD